MRNYLQLFINGQSHNIEGADAWLTLSEYLREHLRLKGTKIVCEEGDCGACSVLVANLQDSDPTYNVIDSCIVFLFQLEGHHIVTVEGLGDGNTLNCVQQSMVDCHGSQCGFCTPGFVMAMTGVMERSTTRKTIATQQWQAELSGNLCRCTGYKSILDACQQTCDSDYESLQVLYPIEDLQLQYASNSQDSICIESKSKKCYLPTSLSECTALREQLPKARLIAGATDVGVQCNKRHTSPEDVISLRRVAEIQSVENDKGWLTFGAALTWTQVLAVCEEHIPQFASVLKHFGSPQIRNIGTLGGNLANASPIADSLPLLHVLAAELELVGPQGSRWRPINGFYTDYKQYDLRPGEMIARVRIPKLKPGHRLRLYKVSRRLDLDISTFTAAISMELQNDRIVSASLAFGAVGPIVLRLPATEKFLTGKPFTAQTMKAAGDVVATEITPISDVRGSADYRHQLAKNVLMKFYYEEVA